ncbi:hypothetical protein CCAX7_12370 [Capsulimonas corticalis]|uniref:Endonuclease GajA/Old nuclease/RecF-like AAA domain-containing protein n=1 Tax=Capsulimonas corticalis TaxID=2219043 RepID=A0A9N7QCH8_9BACT|nr:AAA family ATPase [Capsulimonas corticalis]BDI29186.1 hypothetical protein CCAX7_12370 [Capsulimonas corticalis]
MKLTKFRVQNFRSVVDSGWIETENVTALIGTNESGKTNLLTPLWKLNPAKGGEINPLADYPRKRFNDIRNMDKKPVFIEALFELDDNLVKQIASLAEVPVDHIRIAKVTRDFAGGYTVGFPNAASIHFLEKKEVYSLISDARDDISAIEVGKSEEVLKASMLSTLDTLIAEISRGIASITSMVLKSYAERLNTVDLDDGLKRSMIVPRFGLVVDAMNEMVVRVSKPTPSSNVQARDLVRKNMPTFVYYSNYGNLDSEIYLPHVLDNMQRDDLGSREEAKARTLKVLFEFVKLQPKEILELGRDSPVIITKTVNQANQALSETRSPAPSDEEIREIAAKKKEREVLLTSASADLTAKFRDWWRQGEYRFRFDADGDHFRIWVSDDKRPEEIELEGRSTGLQWFLSFYLTFLVESADDHKDAILLLDEPGQSLHPLAQRDLSKFFDNLSLNNQILYTAHSPFLVDSDHLDRVKAVYVDENGATVVSSDLRAGVGNKAQSNSIYPVNAAVGLSVSETMLEGCQPIIVEGPSDQVFLSAIKTYLIRKGQFTPNRETVFVPSGGVRGVSAVMPILAAKTEVLPYILLDSDKPGEDMAKNLKSHAYQGQSERVIMVSDIIGVAGAEIEDLFSIDLIAPIVDRLLRGHQDEDFSASAKKGEPIIPQIEAYAKQHNIQLPLGWKVDLAKRVKLRILADKNPYEADTQTLLRWKLLFEKFMHPNENGNLESAI